ncbi:MAG: Na+/H+ antiporter NhaA [Maribacter sp.]
MFASIAERPKQFLQRLVASGSSLGIILLVMVVIAMVWANSPWSHYYHELWKIKLTIGFEGAELSKSLHYWVNDFLMAYFFFMVGLEVKREFMVGELSTVKKAVLPLVSALGGMAIPAVIYLAINYNGEGANGWGIPMATDIAFAIGLLALAGNAISSSSKTFLTALATADDIGAILIIAFFLSSGLDVSNLIAAGVYFLIMLGGNLAGVRNVWFYFIVGVFGLWVALFLSGVHATLAGVLAAFCIPARSKISESTYIEKIKNRAAQLSDTSFTDNPLLRENQVQIILNLVKDSRNALSPLQRLEQKVRPIVNFFILPIFALSNAGVTIKGDFLEMLLHPISLGIIAGLCIGKLIGIVSASFLIVKSKIGKLPTGANWSEIGALSMMAGIGFTMSIFIAELSLSDEKLLQIAKVGIITASVISGVVGIGWLKIKSKGTITN